MTPEAAIHSALLSHAAGLPDTLVYPTPGSDEPAGEYVEIRHLPNDNRVIALDYELERMGILQLTLCSPFGEYEIVYLERAGLIAAHFQPGVEIGNADASVIPYRADIAAGFADGQHWRTPVSVYYQAFA